MATLGYRILFSSFSFPFFFFSQFFYLCPGTSCILIAASLLLALISIHISFFLHPSLLSRFPFLFSFFLYSIRRRFIKCSTLGISYLILINTSIININTRWYKKKKKKKYGSIDPVRGPIHLKKKYSGINFSSAFLHACGSLHASVYPASFSDTVSAMKY